MPSPTLPPPVLVAAGLDWLEGLLPFLFVLFWIVSQVWAVVRRAAAPRQQPGVPPGPRPPRLPRPLGDDAAAPAGRGEVPAREELERQIEAFLREAGVRPAKRPDAVAGSAERRPETTPRQTGVPGSRATRPAERPATGAVRRDGSKATASAGDAGAARTRDAATKTLGGDVARHVTEAFATDLKHRITPADTSAASPVPAERTTDFVAMLRDPESLRQLVVMREVLERPVDRW